MLYFGSKAIHRIGSPLWQTDLRQFLLHWTTTLESAAVLKELHKLPVESDKLQAKGNVELVYITSVHQYKWGLLNRYFFMEKLLSLTS